MFAPLVFQAMQPSRSALVGDPGGTTSTSYLLVVYWLSCPKIELYITKNVLMIGVL